MASGLVPNTQRVLSLLIGLPFLLGNTLPRFVQLVLDAPGVGVEWVLFDGYRFGQVARLVDICTFYQRNVVTEQLQRNGVDDRRYAFIYPRQA